MAKVVPVQGTTSAALRIKAGMKSSPASTPASGYRMPAHADFVDGNGHYLPPSQRQAEEYAAKLQPRTPEGYHWPVWKMTTKEMGTEFGCGISLYFRALKWLCVLFLGLFVCQIPWLVAGNLAKYYALFAADRTGTSANTEPQSSEAGGLQRLSLGVLVEDKSPNSSDFVIDANGTETEKWIFLMEIVALDLFAMLLFLLGSWYMRYQTACVRVEVDASTLEISDYTVLVQDMPKDVTEEELTAFFEGHGLPVFETVVVPFTGPVTEHLLAKKKAVQAMHEAHAAWLKTECHDQKALKTRDELVGKVAEINVQIRKNMQGIADSEGHIAAAAAFVSFKTEDAYEQSTKLLPKHFLFRLMVRMFVKRKLLRGRRLLSISEARAPSETNFENLGYTRRQRLFRQCVANGIMTILLIVSFVIIMGLSAAQIQAHKQIHYSVPNLRNGLADALTRTILPGYDAFAKVCPPILQRCSSHVSDFLKKANATLTYGQPVVVFNIETYEPASTIVYNKAWKEVAACAGKVKARKGISLGCTPNRVHCLPCYCAGLAQHPENVPLGMLDTIQSQCQPYIKDTPGLWSARVGVIIGVTLTNYVLWYLMGKLVKFEKHDSVTKEERAYTFKAFVSVFFNTAVLPLVASCQWLFQSTGYKDFTVEWYGVVGSAMVLTILTNATVPQIQSALQPVRYEADLAEGLIALIPWAIILHMCMGLWMHSYFYAPDIDRVLNGQGDNSTDAAVLDSYYSYDYEPVGPYYMGLEPGSHADFAPSPAANLAPSSDDGIAPTPLDELAPAPDFAPAPASLYYNDYYDYDYLPPPAADAPTPSSPSNATAVFGALVDAAPIEDRLWQVNTVVMLLFLVLYAAVGPEGNPPLDEAYDRLKGQKTYRLTANPQYADLWRGLGDDEAMIGFTKAIAGTGMGGKACKAAKVHAEEAACSSPRIAAVVHDHEGRPEEIQPDSDHRLWPTAYSQPSQAAAYAARNTQHTQHLMARELYQQGSSSALLAGHDVCYLTV
ncbi:hypothetical protein WJX72_006694 [[Myrmecia] bisecta]|uniref:CSC1/OSCA1-like cytosolic domain-containing protein n=1 Tax=[Myrmecia] bisecta TaxID=41462 RepID=A0AAW1P5M4_9CHLO